MDEPKEIKSETPDPDNKSNMNVKRTGKQILLEALDIIIYFFVISPCVVCYWRGTWELLEFYLPQVMWIAGWISYAIGITGLLLCYFLQIEMINLVKNVHNILYIILTRFYLYFIGFFCVNHWHGVWKIWDSYTGVSATSGLVSTVLGLAILILLKAVCNNNAPPLAFGMDTSNTMFTISTRFGRQRKDGHEYVLDILLTVILLHGSVVFVWRGTWVMLDALLFPDSKLWSAISSTAAGYCICVIYSIIQIPSAMLHKKLNNKKWLQLLFGQFYWIVAFFGPINVWRGCWMLLDQFFLAEQKPLSQWLTHLIGCLLMCAMVFKCNPVLGYIADGSTVTLKIAFLQEIFLSETKPWNQKRESIENDVRDQRNGIQLNKVTENKTTADEERI